MKLPFSFSLKFVFRLLLPGVVLGLFLLPGLNAVLALCMVKMPPREYTLMVGSLVAGWLFVMLDMPIYMAFEGRRYWPSRLRAWGIERESKRLKKLMAAIQDQSDRNRYVEASAAIRWFPKDGNGQ